MRRKNDLPEVEARAPAVMGHELMLQGTSRKVEVIDDHSQFAEYVRAHAADRPFLAQEDERELIRAAVARFGIRYDEARWMATGILHENGVGGERHLDWRIEDVLFQFSRPGRRKISRKEFNHSVAIYRTWAGNGISEQSVKTKLKRIIEKRDWRVRRSRWTRSRCWFNKIPD